MNFVFTMVLLNVFSTIKSKQKYISSESDIASRNGNLNKDSTSSRGSSSGEDADDFDDEHPGKSLEHFHEYDGDKARKTLESRRWHTSCVRKASKLCTKACRRAFKQVCRKRKCKRRAKKALKRECKKTCTKYFEFDKDRAAQEE